MPRPGVFAISVGRGDPRPLPSPQPSQGCLRDLRGAWLRVSFAVPPRSSRMGAMLRQLAFSEASSCPHRNPPMRARHRRTPGWHRTAWQWHLHRALPPTVLSRSSANDVPQAGPPPITQTTTPGPRSRPPARFMRATPRRGYRPMPPRHLPSHALNLLRQTRPVRHRVLSMLNPTMTRPPRPMVPDPPMSQQGRHLHRLLNLSTPWPRAAMP